MLNRLYITFGLAIVYALTALFGILLQQPDWAVILIWPPSGVALAAVLLLGRKSLPGIFLGALVTNLIVLPVATQPSLIDLPATATLHLLGVALALSATSTLAALVAGRALQRIAPGAPFWSRAAQLLLGTVVIALACIISAGGGMSGLYLLDLLPAHSSLAVWGMWWLANFCGMVIFTPIICLAARPWIKLPPDSQLSPIKAPTYLNSGIAAIALFVFLTLWNAETERIAQSLAQQSALAASRFTEVLRTARRDVVGIRALFYASEHVSSEEFRRYVATEVGERLSDQSTSRVAWAPRITNREAWEASMESELQEKVRIYKIGTSGRRIPVTQRDEYFPVQFIQPLVKMNFGAIGFDLGSDPSRSPALKRARDTGDVAMVAPIIPLQSEMPEPAMLICAAIYRADSAVDTVAARRANLTGFAIGVYLIGPVFDTALGGARANIDLHLFDETLPLGAQWLHTKASPLGNHNAVTAPTLANLKRRPHGTTIMTFADHTWQIVAAPGAGYIEEQRTWIPWGALVLLLCLGVMMSWILMQRLVAQRRVEVAYHEAEQALSRAQAANDSKAFFMAAAGHDIKQPLFALGILADTLLMSDPTASTVPLLKRLRTSIDQMSRHFDALMDVGKFQSDGFEVNPTRFRLREFCEHIDAEIAPLCASKSLLWKLDMDDVSVFTDQELLLRLFRNLLTNAVRYTDFGEVCCSAKANGEIVEFLISDTGIGIETELQDKVFKRFVRLDAGAVGSAGTGLGLSIVEKISQALELDLQMLSILGVGTRFSFRLPL